MRHYYVKDDSTVIDTLDLVTEHIDSNTLLNIYNSNPDSFINGSNRFDGFTNEVFDCSFVIKNGSIKIMTEDVYIEVFGNGHRLSYLFGKDDLFSVVFDNMILGEFQFLHSSLTDCYLRLYNIHSIDNRLILTFICGGFSFKFNIAIDYNEGSIYISDKTYVDAILKNSLEVKNTNNKKKLPKLELIDSFLCKKFANIEYYASIKILVMIV